jgi:hypothetical protein
VSVVIGNASPDDLEIDALHMRALELFLSRAGAKVLTLPVSGISGLGDILTAFRPDAVVVAGSHDADDDVARWAYRVRAVAGALPITLFHRSTRSERVRTTGARLLADSPGEAHRELLAVIESGGRMDAPSPALDLAEPRVLVPRRKVS